MLLLGDEEEDAILFTGEEFIFGEKATEDSFPVVNFCHSQCSLFVFFVRSNV